MALYRERAWYLTTRVCGVVPVQRTLLKMPHADGWKKGCINTGFFYSIHTGSAADLKKFCTSLMIEIRGCDGRMLAQVPVVVAGAVLEPSHMPSNRIEHDECMPEITLVVTTEFSLDEDARMTTGIFTTMPVEVAPPETCGFAPEIVAKVRVMGPPSPPAEYLRSRLTAEEAAAGMAPRKPGETTEAWAARNRPWTRAKCNATHIQRCDDCLEWSCKLQDESQELPDELRLDGAFDDDDKDLVRSDFDRGRPGEDDVGPGAIIDELLVEDLCASADEE